MTYNQHPIGSIAWLDAMNQDFNLNGRKTPAPVEFLLPDDVAKIHSEMGDVVNAVVDMEEKLIRMRDKASDLRKRLDAAKGIG